MDIGPLFRREYVVSIASGELFRDRLRAAVAAGMAVLLCLVVWDWKGWDRVSVAGASRLAHVAFAVVVAVQVVLVIGFVLAISRTIAGERDRKTLDALLASRLSSLQIVVGVMAAGLFRFANVLAATVPVMALMIYLGGVDGRWALVACVGLASTALGVAAVSVVASVGSRTAARGLTAAVALMNAWFVLPYMILVIRAVALPRAPVWLIRPLLWVLDSSPLGPPLSSFGIFPRPWGLVSGVLRMAAMQIAIAGGFTAWAVWRLRPASRALYDVEGRKGVLRALRAANRWLPARRPCGADPVFWNARYTYQAKSRAARVAERLINLTGMVMLGIGVWWFAGPAFVELGERGYGPSAEAYRMPEMNPFARVLVEHLFISAGSAAAPGQARLEFNISLREFAAMIALTYLFAICTYATESVRVERQRDTWLGLLATPLSGGEIIRGKVLGALWRARGWLAVLLILWTLGLASGAVHPFGFLAVVVWLVASALFFGALGISAGLQPVDPEALLHPAVWFRVVVALLIGMAQTAVLPLALASASLFTYEDVQAAFGSGVFPLLSGTSLRNWVSARAAAFACLAGIAATAVWTALAVRNVIVSFDTLVDRPRRPAENEEPGETASPH